MALTSELLLDYLSQNMGLDSSQLDEKTLLFSSNLLDSFSMVDMIMFIEQEAGIKMEAGDVNLDNLDSIERILKFVHSCAA
ncbi:MAG: acyl carrier protein [Pseudomonadota bacterium]|nr:acyl carrier protein [Pseudomonadota bacterium]